jgi:CRP/FNR family transcriptional regulator, cyclic AMP receptor protein
MKNEVLDMEKVLFYKAGETIITEGDRGKGFYILKEGNLNVQKDGISIATITEPGTIFGEMSDILNEPRTCTITSKTDSYVIHIPRDIDGIIASYPSVAKKMILTLAKRLEDTTKNLLVFKTED